MVSIMIRYVLDSLWIESQWQRDFPNLSRPAMGVGWPGRGVDHHPRSSFWAFMICYRMNFKLYLIIIDTLYTSCPETCGLLREWAGRRILCAASSYTLVNTVLCYHNLHTWVKSIKPEQLTGSFPYSLCSETVALYSKRVHLTCGTQNLP
jgi:hypothetical protein